MNKPCRGVLHTPENIRLELFMHSGRMRYAPTKKQQTRNCFGLTGGECGTDIYNPFFER